MYACIPSSAWQAQQHQGLDGPMQQGHIVQHISGKHVCLVLDRDGLARPRQQGRITQHSITGKPNSATNAAPEPGTEPPA
eukprot:13179272-Alexandrium_andersonii.AAC.1